MATRRTTRLSALVQSELGRLASREKDLEGMLLTFTSVEVTPDLRQAFVYVSSLNDKLDPELVLKKLSHLAHEWQQAINARLKIKYTPRLTYRYDVHLKRGDRVMDIFHQLEEKEGPPPEPDTVD